MTEANLLRISQLGNGSSPRLPNDIPLIPLIANKKNAITEIEARALIKLLNCLFKKACVEAGYPDRKITALTTKFRDAGRRSAPWRPTSSRVPGRPQDGSDGNRINRWLMPVEHKFYADEVNATLVEAKYYLQALSMLNAPDVSTDGITNCFTPWLVKHPVTPGAYKDPLQRIDIDFNEFIENPRIMQSGHLDPLDRTGRHVPDNTYLMYYRSNQIQGNLKMDELLELMERIHKDHKLDPFI